MTLLPTTFTVAILILAALVVALACEVWRLRSRVKWLEWREHLAHFKNNIGSMGVSEEPK